MDFLNLLIMEPFSPGTSPRNKGAGNTLDATHTSLKLLPDS